MICVRGRLGMLGLGLVLLAGCNETTSQAILEIEATGNVQGFLFLDLNGSGLPEPNDDGIEGWEVRLEQPGGGVLATAVSDTAGAFEFEDVSTGQMVLSLDSSLLGDTVEIFGTAFESFTLGLGETKVLQPGVTYPSHEVADVRTLDVGTPVFATGIALNSLSLEVRELHVWSDGSVIRVTDLPGAGILAGDSVRVFGRTARDLGQPILGQGEVFPLGIATSVIEPVDVTTAVADAADGGALDAALVQVLNAAVIEVEDLNLEGLRVVIDDGSGPFELRLRSFLGQSSDEIQADSTDFERIRGLLVPREDALAAGPERSSGRATVRWTLLPRSQADYSLENPDPSGTITITKTIQSSTGGLADNPSNPLRDGFVFQIRKAGTTEVAAQITTDAGGTAQATVPAGSYDISEIDAQGLTDFTFAVTNVVVNSGGSQGVTWINRQAPLPGTITIQKDIQASGGGPPNNPPNQLKDGFRFDILETGTTIVAATVTTDNNGLAQASLPDGTYDIVETDSKGLTDVTLAINTVIVSAGNNPPAIQWVNQQAPPPGTITITKTIQSSSGGPPNNPFSPQFNGFVFQVFVNGTANLVETLTTDAAGSAQVTLPAGSYDVFETDSQGLISFTPPQISVTVNAGQNTPLTWVNRQPPQGTITIQKVIQSSTGGLADNPPNPPLNGFIFEFREAGTAIVAATVQTDASGQARAALPDGFYDIVEINSQGLTDTVGQLSNIPAASGTDFPVGWVNRQLAPALRDR